MIYIILTQNNEHTEVKNQVQNIHYLDAKNERIKEIRKKIGTSKYEKKDKSLVDKENLSLIENIIYFLFKDFLDKQIMQIQFLNIKK